MPPTAQIILKAPTLPEVGFVRLPQILAWAFVAHTDSRFDPAMSRQSLREERSNERTQTLAVRFHNIQRSQQLAL